MLLQLLAGQRLLDDHIAALDLDSVWTAHKLGLLTARHRYRAPCAQNLLYLTLVLNLMLDQSNQVERLL